MDLLARVVCRWPKAILVVTLLLVGAGAYAGLGVEDRLGTGGYTDPAAESSTARAELDRTFPAGRPNLVLLVTAPGGVDSPAAVAAGRRLTARLAAEPGVTGVASYWQTASPDLRSRDRTAALIAAHGPAEPARADSLRRAYRGTHGPVHVAVGGSAVVNADVVTTSGHDLRRSELLAIPIVAVILVLVFRGLIASLLPLLVGLTGIVGTTVSLWVVAAATDVSVFALNLAVGLGLGLAVDYALFLVRRQREELRRGADVPAAVRTTLDTAGRTVAFSAATVVVSMSAMLLFPMYFLRSFAYAGISVVLLAATAALVPLPAALVVAGHRLGTAPTGRGGAPGWRRVAEAVTRRPLLVAVATTAVLVTVAVPFLGVRMGMPDDRTLPASAESHQVQRQLRDDFPVSPGSQVDVVTRGARPGESREYARRLSALPDVERVTSAAGIHVRGRQVVPAGPAFARFTAGETAQVSVSTDVPAMSERGTALVRAIRALSPPFGVLVGGDAAELLDTQASMAARLPWALGLIAATTLMLLFLLSGSVLVPVKAVVMNVLSLSATFGVLVWIFQEGHLAGVLGFQVTGWVMVQLLVLLFTVAFGVSMDYEVFLLSRIREEYTRSGDNHRAVVFGLERTGGVVTAAAVITAVVFVAMASSRLTHIKMFGLGLAVAVLLDAFVVRALLVPALMQLAGRANWWAPRLLGRLHARFGLTEERVRRPAGAPTGASP
jgi:RND superfamily putative drug exporter